MAKKHLTRKGVEFTEVTIDDDSIEFLRELDALEAPVVVLEDSAGFIMACHTGFRPELLDRYAEMQNRTEVEGLPAAAPALAEAVARFENQ